MYCEIYTIQEFMQAWFNKDYSKINAEDFSILHSEYLDISGLYLSEDFEKIAYINNLSSRLNYVKLFVSLQRDFMQEFRSPFIRDFEHLKEKYGYVLKWNEDLEDFEEQLQRVEMREIKFGNILNQKIDELSKLRKSNVDDEEAKNVSLKDTRYSFIRMINSLGKIGFKIDKFTTTVEELALMIKQQFEEIEQLENKQLIGR